MSLYGGIKFAAGPTIEEQSEAGPSTARSAKSARPRAEAFLDDPPVPSPTNSALSSVPEKIKVTEKSSAVLSFAPRINKARTAPKPSLSATTYSAPPVDIPSASVRTAEPVMNSQSQKEGIVLGDDGKALARAPAMTLTAKSASGWKNNNADGSKKRKKKKKKRAQLIPSFDPDEQYDPNRPNDLAEYQSYRRRVKEQRREKFMEEKRRRQAGESSGDSSYYTDSEEEVAPRRDAPKMWAPPREYGAGPSAAPPPTVPKTLSGDDAFARRLAMAKASSGDSAPAGRTVAAEQSARQETGDDVYARRAALSEHPPYPPSSPWTPPPPPSEPSMPPPPPGHDIAPPPPPPQPDVEPPPPPPSKFYPPPPSLAPTSVSNSGIYTPSSKPFVPPPASLIAGAPGLTALPFQPPSRPPAQLPFPPPFPPNQSYTPVTSSLPPPPPVATPEQEKFNLELEEKRKALAAIAAKFSSLPGAPAPAVPFEAKEGESFANKMMRKWGHKEGSAIGARGDGLTEALTVEHMAGQAKNPAQMSKRQLAKQKAAEANAKSRKWVQHPTARGKIINAAEEERQKEEKGKYGEASRVVCLVGVVGDIEEVDDDLAQDIGEECSKYGIVERVVLHMVEPAPEDPAESLRVFVVFTGMAGAWRSIRELDGRFFAGKKIRAAYFDETKFEANERDGPIL